MSIPKAWPMGALLKVVTRRHGSGRGDLREQFPVERAVLHCGLARLRPAHPALEVWFTRQTEYMLGNNVALNCERPAPRVNAG